MTEEEKLRREIGEAITELIFASQELGFELALCECEKKSQCPVVQKAKEVIVKVKKLFELQRRTMRRSVT